MEEFTRSTLMEILQQEEKYLNNALEMRESLLQRTMSNEASIKRCGASIASLKKDLGIDPDDDRSNNAQQKEVCA